MVELRPAGLATRAAARAVDGLCQLVLSGACLLLPALIIERMAAQTQAEATARVGLLLAAVLGVLASAWLYPVFFELLWAGRTPGKRMLGLAVTDTQGRAPRPAAVVMRNLLLLVDLLPGLGLAGLAVASIDPLHRRVGDLVAGTMVIEQPRSPMGAANESPPAREPRTSTPR